MWSYKPPMWVYCKGKTNKYESEVKADLLVDDWGGLRNDRIDSTVLNRGKKSFKQMSSLSKPRIWTSQIDGAWHIILAQLVLVQGLSSIIPFSPA